MAVPWGTLPAVRSLLQGWSLCQAECSLLCHWTTCRGSGGAAGPPGWSLCCHLGPAGLQLQSWPLGPHPVLQVPVLQGPCPVTQPCDYASEKAPDSVEDSGPAQLLPVLS